MKYKISKFNVSIFICIIKVHDYLNSGFIMFAEKIANFVRETFNSFWRILKKKWKLLNRQFYFKVCVCLGKEKKWKESVCILICLNRMKTFYLFLAKKKKKIRTQDLIMHEYLEYTHSFICIFINLQSHIFKFDTSFPYHICIKFQPGCFTLYLEEKKS